MSEQIRLVDVPDNARCQVGLRGVEGPVFTTISGEELKLFSPGSWFDFLFDPSVEIMTKSGPRYYFVSVLAQLRIATAKDDV